MADTLSSKSTASETEAAAADRVKRVAESLEPWSKERLAKLAMGLAVHRVRSGQDALGLTASSVSASSEAQLRERLSGLCQNSETAQMVMILMQVTVPYA